MRHASAANRIVIAALAAYAGATLLLGIAIFFATHAAFSRQIDARIAQTAATLASEFREDGARGVIDALRERRGGGPDPLGFALFAPDAHRVGGDLAVAMPAPGWRTLDFIDPVEGPDPARALTVPLAGGYRLVVAQDLSALEDIDDTILTMFGAAFAMLMLVGTVCAAMLARYLRGRLAAIGTTADAIIAGDLARRASVGSRGDEFDRAAASLNAMLDRIAELVASLRQVTGDLAHDLRTPLSRLRNQLERLLGPLDEPGRHAFIETALGQADEVLVLFDAILRISEVEEGSLRKAFGLVDLSELTIDLGETMGPLVDDSGHVLLVSVEPRLVVPGDRELLAQAVINLVENALRHTPQGSTIHLGLARRAEGVVLAVRDDGPGIPAQDRERVQQRFVRLEYSRSTPGHGLGLSLVRAIARAHAARLVLADAQPGLVAEMVFASNTKEDRIFAMAETSNDHGTAPARALAKVPAVTMGFWVLKVLATTLGETAGDAVTMTWLGETTATATGWGYLIGTGIFVIPLLLLVAAQIRASRFHPVLYWATIIASTMAGTTLADFFDRSLGIGYAGGSLALFACVIASLAVWKRTLGTVSVNSVASLRAELFYWVTITFSQTLGTALGDWTADSFGDATFLGLDSGYVLGSLVFAAALAVVALLSRFTSLPRPALFWAAFILTRPLGATLGDFLDKPLAKGGLDFSRPVASAVLLAAMVAGLVLIPQKPADAEAGH